MDFSTTDEILTRDDGILGDRMREAIKRRDAEIAEYGYDEYKRRLEEKRKAGMAQSDAEEERRRMKERSMESLENSGLKESIEIFRFDNFDRDEPFKCEMYDMCQRFIAQNDKRFLYISGQPGCGKTHIGTAVCATLINQGKQTIYAVHAEIMAKMKSNVNDDEYEEVLKEYGMARVLYIDDFMKPVYGTNREGKRYVIAPTGPDIKHSFNIINMRVVNRLTTIITSERSLNEIIQIDEALGSRIKQMSGEFAIDIARKEGRNYRLKG